jgi:pyruvate oxidase
MYRCNVCGYIHDEAKEGVKFKDLADDYVCPVCNAPKEEFEQV